MITPPQNLKGTSGSPITVRALNDGKVLINGQGARSTVMLYINDWFVIEGINACCSSESVVQVGGSNHTIRRVIGWDAGDINAFIFGVHGGDHNLLEDVAGWGIARKVFDSSSGGNYTTIRRAWGRWEGSHFSGPKMTYTLAYDNYSMLCENCIGTWSGEKMKQTYTLLCPSNPTYRMCGQTFSSYQVDQPQGIFSDDGFNGDKNARSKLLGSIAYVQRSDRFPYQYAILITGMDSFEIANTVSYIEPGSNSEKYTFGLDGGSSSTNLIARNLTSIGGAGVFIDSGWQKSSITSGQSLATTFGSNQSIFNASSGANICYQYQDGVLTNKPLWPWPMNQRIKDAMIASGRSSVDITASIESMFGPAPAACKSGSTAVSKPSAPINLQAHR